MRKFKSLSELFVANSEIITTIQTTVEINGKAITVSISVPGAPSDPNDESALSSFLSDCPTELTASARGALSTGLNSKGKPVYPTSKGPITGETAATFLPWHRETASPKNRIGANGKTKAETVPTT